MFHQRRHYTIFFAKAFKRLKKMCIINLHKNCNKKARKASQKEPLSKSDEPKKTLSKSDEPKKVSGPIDDPSEDQKPLNLLI